MCRHMTPEDAACGVCHHDKDVEQAQGGRDHHTEVTRNNPLGMIAPKSPPSLGRRRFPSTRVQAFGKILVYGAW